MEDELVLQGFACRSIFHPNRSRNLAGNPDQVATTPTWQDCMVPAKQLGFLQPHSNLSRFNEVSCMLICRCKTRHAAECSRSVRGQKSVDTLKFRAHCTREPNGFNGDQHVQRDCQCLQVMAARYQPQQDLGICRSASLRLHCQRFPCATT